MNDYHSTWYKGKRAKMHRLVYMWENKIDFIPKGYDVHHTCGNPGCLNGDHMVLLKHSEHLRQHKLGNRNALGHYGYRLAQIHPEHGLLKVWDSLLHAGDNGYSMSAICNTLKGTTTSSSSCWWMRLKKGE